MSGAILMGRPSTPNKSNEYLSLTLNLMLKITDFINLILDIIISCFHNKTRLDNVSSFVSFEKSR